MSASRGERQYFGATPEDSERGGSCASVNVREPPLLLQEFTRRASQRGPRGAEGRPATAPRATSTRRRLLHLDRRARLLELGLDRVGLLARDALLHRVRGLVDEILRLLQAEAGDGA